MVLAVQPVMFIAELMLIIGMVFVLYYVFAILQSIEAILLIDFLFNVLFFIYSLISGRKYLIIIYIFIFYIFQNFFIGIISNLLDFSTASTSLIRHMLILKDMTTIFIFLLVSLLLLFRKPYKIEKQYIFPFFIGIYLIASLFWYKTGNSIVALAYIRNLIMPFIFLIIGYTLASFKSLRYLIYSFIFMLAVETGVVLYELLSGYRLWYILKGELINLARGFGDVTVTETIIFEHVLVRLSGSFLDSVNFSYFLATAFAILFIYKQYLNKFIKPVYYFILSCIFLFLILTLGKGGWMIFYFFILGYALPMSFYLKNYKKVLMFMLVLILFSIPIVNYVFPTAIFHFIGLYNSLLNISIMGHGLGSGGNFAKGFSHIPYEKWLASSESGFGTMLYQLGAVFTFIYYLYWFLVIKKINNNYHNWLYTGHKKLIQVQVFIIFGWLTASLFQENSFSPNANFAIFSFLGINLKILKDIDDYDA
ncbi:hypothetical protein [Hydrogenivirga sp. 128-5-R1-1]|uniref:hypothetical protein n=1 Tax=Hydrogenivirga sp. 128-5-R1-1 TaxID=392423 RepID=UPI00015EF7E2|nr:hypothetical protein [Hydrogenivirga sp. 128-5-R1-1]EDP75582.1 hypothetical protein HG1285_16500 [Hydrogenivirga sp. 128-5-R1-1]